MGEKIAAFDIDTFVIIPTYNEVDNIGHLIQQLLDLPHPLGLIIVDDNSPDGTGRLADEWALMHPQRIYAIHRPRKMGLGTAYIAGFKLALSLPHVKRIMTMDADFSHNPRYIPAMLQLSQHKQMVIGSRYVPGGASSNCTWKRVLLSKTANLVAKTILGLRAMDTTAGFRLYQRAVLETIDLDLIFSNGYSFLIEILFLCQQSGWQIGEVPIVFEDRRMGTTKISRQEIFKAQYTVLRLFVLRLVQRTSSYTAEPI